jgi:hypothetical protein
MVGLDFIEVSIPFDERGQSSSGGSVCIAAVLCVGRCIIWVLALTTVGLVEVV